MHHLQTLIIYIFISILLQYEPDDAILPRRGPISKVMARRLQEDWVRDTGEDLRVLMSLMVDFEPMG